MAALSNACLFQGVSIRSLASHGQVVPVYSSSQKFQASLMGDFRSSNVRHPMKWMRSSQRNVKRFPSVMFAIKDGQFDPLSVEPPPYHSYMDSTSGQLEPASGARASIPGKEYWPEGTADRVRAARTPEPVAKSETKPSYGKKPGSRRKRYKANATASENSEVIVNVSAELDSRNGIDTGFDLNGNINKDNKDDFSLPEASGLVESLNESKEPSDEYVIYQVEEPENLSPYEMDKKIGRPHPFLDPSKVRPIEEPQTSEDLWWNWRKPEEGRWSRWQRRRPDVDTVFAKAMAETGQIKLYGDQPTLTEAALAKARKEVFKEERLQAEQRRLEEVGPIAYYSEWVKAWTKDTSREAVQKHFEETGEDENTQLITMFQHQTAEEYRIMMGTDVRIRRDPLAMRMREELIKEIWGGDPVYPTINYIQDPDEVIDYRGPNFHEPTPDIVDYLMEHGKMISREELNEILAKEKKQDVEVTDIDEAMASAVDIGENDDEDREDDENGEEHEEEYEEDVEEKISRNWSVLKTTPQPGKSTENPKVNGPMSLQEAIDDSENLTDFLLDFDEDE